MTFKRKLMSEFMDRLQKASVAMQEEGEMIYKDYKGEVNIPKDFIQGFMNGFNHAEHAVFDLSVKCHNLELEIESLKRVLDEKAK